MDDKPKVEEGDTRVERSEKEATTSAAAATTGSPPPPLPQLPPQSPALPAQVSPTTSPLSAKSEPAPAAIEPAATSPTATRPLSSTGPPPPPPPPLPLPQPQAQHAARPPSFSSSVQIQPFSYPSFSPMQTGSGGMSSGAMAGGPLGAPFAPPFLPQPQPQAPGQPTQPGHSLHLHAPTMQSMPFHIPPMQRMPLMAQHPQAMPPPPFAHTQPMVAFTPPFARVPIPALPASFLHAPSQGGGPSIAQMMHMLHDGQMIRMQQDAQLSQMQQQQQSQMAGSAPGAPITVARVVQEQANMQGPPLYLNGSSIAEKDMGGMSAEGAKLQLQQQPHLQPLYSLGPSTSSMTHYAAILTPPGSAASGLKQESELKQPESLPEVRGHQVRPPSHAQSEAKSAETNASTTTATHLSFPGAAALACPTPDESAVLAAAAAAAAATTRESPPLPHLPAESASPAEMREALQQLRAQNRQLQRCYQHVKGRFHDVLELVDKSTSGADEEPPEVLLQIHGILSEAAARDSMLQTVGVEEDHDPHTTVPSTPRHGAPLLSYGASQASTQIAGRSNPRGRQRGKPPGFDAAELTGSGGKRKREPSVGVGSSPATPGGAMDFEAGPPRGVHADVLGLLSLSHLANVPQGSGVAAAAAPRLGLPVTADDRKSLIHTTGRVRKDAVAHSYGTRPSNRSTKFILEPSPPPSESDEEAAGTARGPTGVSRAESSMAAQEDADATSDDYEFEEEGYDEDELMADEEYTVSSRAPRVRIRNRSKAARAAAGLSTAPSTTSPASASSSMSVSARKRSLAPAGHHAMTAISQDVNRYPLLTVYVKVAQMWTVGKNEARQMSREDQTALVLVPVRFMVLNADHRADPERLTYDDVLVIAKDISVLIHKRKDTVAKCWGQGTRLMLYDGSSKPVEEIHDSDLLMGDDSTPRRVQSGSVFHGHTSNDTSDLTDAAPSMYRVTSSNAARSSWTCNSDHILVLKFHQPPSAVEESQHDHGRAFCFHAFALEDGEVVRQSFHFSARAEAVDACERAAASWQPLVWECTVNQFLACSDAVKQAATMFQPDLVNFPAPSNTLLKRLGVAAKMRPEQLTQSLVEHTAWALGVWLADGSAGTPRLDKIYVDLSRQELISRLEEWCAIMVGANGDHIHSAARGGSVHGRSRSIKLGPVGESLLHSYGLDKEKYFPPDILRESKEVRTALLAGVVDGNGSTDQHDGSAYKLSFRSRRLADGVVHLARSLGIRTSAVVETKRTNEEMCTVDRTFGVTIEAASASTVSQPATSRADKHCDSFKIAAIGHGDYYGFTLDGDGRCLLEDFTVSHNSIYNFDDTEKMRVHVCSRPREAGRGSGVVGGGASISGGGASTTGLSTQVLTVLSYRGVQRLLRHSRSSLAPHVRRWVDQQYAAIVSDRHLLEEHRVRSQRMEELKLLPAAQARAEETKQLKMEEEDEMDVYEGFEQLAPGEGVSEEISSDEATSVKEERSDQVRTPASRHAADEFAALPTSALAAVAAAAAASESGAQMFGTDASFDVGAPASAPTPTPRSHRKKTATPPRRSYHKAASSAQPAPKRAKVAKPAAAAGSVVTDAAGAAAGGAEAGSVAPDGDGASTATGTSVEHETGLPGAGASAGGAVRVSKRATKGKKKKEPEFLTEGAETPSEALTPASATEGPQVSLPRISTATMAIDPNVYQAEVVAASPPQQYDAMLLAPHMFPPGLAASAAQMQQAPLIMPSVPLTMQAQLAPFPVHGQSSMLTPSALHGAIQSDSLQPAPTSPLHFLASASSAAAAASLAPDSKQTGVEMSSGAAPVYVSELSPSNAALEKAQQAPVVIGPSSAPSAHTSPLFEAAARRSSVDTAMSELHSPHHAADRTASNGAATNDNDAASRSLLHVTITPATTE